MERNETGPAPAYDNGVKMAADAEGPRIPRGVEAGQTMEARGRAIGRVAYASFGQALELLRSGAKVARSGWNGRGQYIQLQLPDEKSKMSQPYIYIRTVQGELVPWVASQTDLLAHDWCLVEERTALKYHDRPGVVVEGEQLARF